MNAILSIDAGFLNDAAMPDHGEMKAGLLPGGQCTSLIYRGNGLSGNKALMQWGRDTGTSFEAIDSKLSEPYASRNEAYLADCRMEPRKLLRDVELSIKIGA